ncbi:hypothetical protein ACEUZ9_004074 [Paracoccus litorisediminis]|uniref:hypothetical protein n=1 Tax=Paracoccus litorisediminis TaxID=2006130 RepID=UPI003733B9EA
MRDQTNGWTKHVSSDDASVNWTRPTPDGGLLEARYVRRTDEYFIAYVSSHSGCRHACRFCHLTQTGQTMFRETPIEEIYEQFGKVIEHYDALKAPADRVNINFMARGEPLSNADLTRRFGTLSDWIRADCEMRDIGAMFNISSIFPQDSAGIDLARAFRGAPVTIFWSLYSLDPRFRRRWLPRAQEPQMIRDRLLAWQEATGGKVVLHWALIDGQNDDAESLGEIHDFIAVSGLDARLNLVRYNTHSAKTGSEAAIERYEDALKIIGDVMTVSGSRIVPRVGFDVNASCGMFMSV